MPDRVLVFQGGRYAAISYATLISETSTGRFVWSASLPGDAQVVGTTWQYVRRDGGPDRRFANNRQIPIVLVAYLALRSSTGLEVVLQSTRLGAVEAVGAALSTLAPDAHEAAPAPRDLEPRVRDALAALGLSSIPTRQDLDRLHRELALRNHPDRFSTAPAEVQAFALERMKEVNAAVDVLRPLVGKAEAANESPSALIGAEVPTVSSGSRATSVEAMALAAALVVAALTCAAFRVGAIEELLASASTQHASTIANANPAPSAQPEAIPRACVVRSERSGSAAPVATVAAGAKVVVVESVDGWRRVKRGDTVEGWTGPRCWLPPAAAGRPCRDDSDCASERCIRADDGSRGTCE